MIRYLFFIDYKIQLLYNVFHNFVACGGRAGQQFRVAVESKGDLGRNRAQLQAPFCEAAGLCDQQTRHKTV